MSHVAVRCYALMLGGTLLLLNPVAVQAKEQRTPGAPKRAAPAPLAPPKAATDPAGRQCSANLIALDKGATRWALAHKKRGGFRVADAVLFGTGGYLKAKPKCPAGGTYRYGVVGQYPTCSIKGHVPQGWLPTQRGMRDNPLVHRQFASSTINVGRVSPGLYRDKPLLLD